MEFVEKQLCEKNYTMADEGKNASLFCTGNGFMGVRGSLEEFGSAKVQGFFIRGIIDEIIEIVEPMPDNVYMRKHYFDEEKLKKFDRQVSCINIADFLLIRFTVGGRAFYPWEGTLLSWDRRLDAETGVLTRKAAWDDGQGNVTEFVFERFASYADEHKYVMRATASAVNHRLPIAALSGMDLNVRTNGQIVTKTTGKRVTDKGAFVSISTGSRYGFSVALSCVSGFAGANKVTAYEHDGIVGQYAEGTGKLTVEKCVYADTSRDSETYQENALALLSDQADYDAELRAHLVEWRELFGFFDVKIEGDDAADAALRYANYQTVITAALNDSIHSLSAKGLSGEKYNQFVWWDCEIYQLPVFLFAKPQVVRHALEYRYRLLPAARENAVEQGVKGARYPFVSSVDGKEHVWIYARHPFLQIHIMADIAYAVLEYYNATGDFRFMEDMGLEMLIELMRFWAGRAELTDGRYELKDVTGTDEHHPHVDNDAYTNYLVKTCFDRSLKLFDFENPAFARAAEKTNFLPEERALFASVAEKLYLPEEENGFIPQFTGYSELSESLELSGKGMSKNFQMKAPGLYHKSKVIKQPDVTLLYSYVNAGLNEEHMALNCDFYEQICEASSSLTYPVHAVCAARTGKPYTFLKHFDDTVNVDIKDVFGTAYQGLHAGCLAGGRFAVLRALIGFTAERGRMCINPCKMPFWKELSLKFVFRGTMFYAKHTGNEVELTTDSAEAFTVESGGKLHTLHKKLILRAI